MNTPLPWITSAQEELLLLDQQHAAGRLDPSSAYRAQVLLARLEQARAAGLEMLVLPELRVPRETVASIAVWPEPLLILTTLDAELEGMEDAFGELLDTLLDADDLVTVADAFGHTEETQRLGELANAHVSLWPERTAILGNFADARLATMPATAGIRALWETISSAAADAVVNMVPPLVPASPSLSQRRLLRRLRASGPRFIEEDISKAPALESLFAVAAAVPSASSEEAFTGERVGLFRNPEGQWLVQMELQPGTRPVGDITLRVSAHGRATEWKLRPLESSRRTVIAKLGTLEELRERLRAGGLDAPPGELRLEVSLEVEEASE